MNIPKQGRRGRPGREAPRSLDAVGRSVRVMDVLMNALGPVGLSEVAKATDQTPASAYRILVTLVHLNWVTHDEAEQTYKPSALHLQYGLEQLSRLDVCRLGQNYLILLQQQTNETAALALAVGDERIYVAQAESTEEVRQTFKIGTSVPMYAGGSGRAILAFWPQERQRRYLSNGPFPALTEYTLTDPHELAAELHRIRNRGYAVSVGERNLSSTSVAAPVFNHLGQPVAALAIAGPHQRLEGQRIDVVGQLVRQAAASLSGELGTRVPRTTDPAL